MKRLLLFLTLIAAALAVGPLHLAYSAWNGVDESIVEKYAEEHGREAKDPYINTDNGDLLLFVFLLGGAIGGFIGGYSWRMLTEQKRPAKKGKLEDILHG